MNAHFAFKTQLLLLVFIVMAGVVNSQTAGNFKLVSSAFKEGKPIPPKYTCDALISIKQREWEIRIKNDLYELSDYAYDNKKGTFNIRFCN